MLNVKLSTHAQSSNQHVLTLELTDEVNPFFYYSFHCTEADFHYLKNEQNFIFDFQMFPNVIKDHIKYCLATLNQE